MYNTGIEIPKVSFSALSYSSIPVNSYFMGFDLDNLGKLSKVDNTGTITILEGGSFGGITLNDLSANSPLVYNNLTGVFDIDQSNSSTSGYLSTLDWNTFNNKQDSITLTTTGTSGSATFVGNTLNIPTYDMGGAGTVTSIGILLDDVGTDINISNSPITTSGDITINIPSASSTVTGKLLSTDWITFNSKQNALGYTPANIAGDTFTGNIFALNLSGTNTGDETQSTIKTKLGAATASVDGYLTSTDWITFNSKQNALGFTAENVANKSTNTSLGTSDILYPTQNAVKVYTDNILGNANALIYKGTIDCSINPNYPAADAGWMYIASVAGKIGGVSGTTVEVGDMIICNTDGTVSGDQAIVGQYWNVIQKNIIGAVTGPSSSVNNTVAVFDGTTGKVIKEGSITDTGTNIGIGTVTPTTKLEVNGSYKFGPAGGVLFSSYGAGTNLDMVALNTGGWTGANRILTSDLDATVFFGAYGSNTSLIRSYWTIGNPSISTTGYDLTTGIHLLKDGNVGIGTDTPAYKLDVNGNVRISGSLNVNNAYALPTTDGTVNQVLQTNGAGVVTWATAASSISSLNNLSATAQTFATGTSGTDFGISSTGSTHTFNIPTASATNTGKLSSTDWTIFNGKQNALSYTPANIAGDTFTGPISATNLSGTNTGDETQSTIKTKLGAASTSQDGYLTSADWNTFNSKGNGTVTSVGLSMPSAFTVSSSPVTGSGTIAVTGAGTASQYVSGDGTLATFPTTLPTNQIIQDVKLGEAIPTGYAVYVFTANGTNIIVKKASNDAEATSSKTLGLLAAGGALNLQTTVVTNGRLAGLNTSTATIGDAVWLGTGGQLLYGLINKPYAPAHLVYIGVVTRVNGSNGEIFVNVQNGFELDELHNVDARNPSNNDGIFYNTTNSLWEHKSIATALGYTPVAGSGTVNYMTKFTASNTIGNSLVQDNGTTLAIGTTPSSTVQFLIQSNKSRGLSVSGLSVGVLGEINLTSANGNYYGVYGDSNLVAGSATRLTYGVYGITNGGRGVFGISSSGGYDNIGVEGQAKSDGFGTPGLNIGGKFIAVDATNNYSLQLIDGTEIVAGRFLKNIVDGKANWSTLTVADTGLTLTTTGSSGAATLVGNTLNIPQYTGGGGSTSFIPAINSLEIFRGRTFRFDSTTADTVGGINTLNNASSIAVAPNSTNFGNKYSRLRYYASIVSTGRVTSIRSTDLQWFIGGGFRFVSTWRVADTVYGSTCQNFHGLIGTTAEIAVGGATLIQVSTLTNCIFVGNDGSDANLQVMHNDASGTCTKIDLGVNFPANRTAGAAMTTMYAVEIYNSVNSTDVKYQVTNLETGSIAQGTIATNLPASTQGLAIQTARVMGTPLTNTGQWEQHKWGCSDITI